MFDNPRKELQRLEDQLLAAEEAEWKGQWEEASQEQEESDLEEDTISSEEVPAQRSSRTPMLLALLLIEIGVLFAALAWWLLWR